MNRKLFLSTACLLLIISLPVKAAEDYISGRFWWESDPFIGGIEYPQTDEQALKFMLEEARWVFSGMIYGFSFRYTPPDTLRQVEKVYELTPLQLIPWGDPSLEVLSTWVERDRYSADLGYLLSGVPRMRRQAWESNIYPSAEGTGEASLFEGFSARKKALEDGILRAVHGFYRQRMGTAPREITGEVCFFDVPYILIREGVYASHVRIRMNLKVTEQLLF